MWLCFHLDSLDGATCMLRFIVSLVGPSNSAKSNRDSRCRTREAKMKKKGVIERTVLPHTRQMASGMLMPCPMTLAIDGLLVISAITIAGNCSKQHRKIQLHYHDINIKRGLIAMQEALHKSFIYQAKRLQDSGDHLLNKLLKLSTDDTQVKSPQITRSPVSTYLKLCQLRNLRSHLGINLSYSDFKSEYLHTWVEITRQKYLIKINLKLCQSIQSVPSIFQVNIPLCFK